MPNIENSNFQTKLPGSTQIFRQILWSQKKFFKGNFKKCIYKILFSKNKLIGF